MKRKFIVFGLALVLAMMSLVGCGTNPTDAPVEPSDAPVVEQADYKETYGDILEEYYSLIKNPGTSAEYEDGKMGVIETAQYLGDEALSTIGYLIEDINGDEVPELLIGTSNQEEGAYTKNDIYAVYAIKDGQPSFVLEGRSRSSYSYIGNGKFYYGGSGGAMYRIFGTYELKENAELVCNDFNFSYEKDESYEEIGFYHNTTGVYEKSAAEEMKISSDEFWAMEDALAEQTVEVNFTPFLEIKLSGQGGTSESPVKPSEAAFCGNWKCTTQTGDGSKYTLFVDLLSDGTASYECGPFESEIITDFKGTWTTDSTGETLTLKMNERSADYNFDGSFRWSINGGKLDLQHISGDSFLYDTEGTTFHFN